jgi:hypothetical protein
MCEKRGNRVTRSEEILFRQVFREWIDDDGPSSQAFRPTRAVDEACLSAACNSKTTVEDAFALHTSPSPMGFGMQSVGVWGLSVGEIENEKLEAWEDPVGPVPPHPANPAHAVIEFGGLGDKQCKRIGRLLKLKATERGRLHP